MTNTGVPPAVAYVGTYTRMEPDARGKGEGIYQLAFDRASGELTQQQVTPDVSNPSFLALSPSGKTLYAANELTDGAVSSFDVDPASGALTFLNREASHGADPCYVSVDASGKVVFVANYSSGSVAVLAISEDGSLQPASDVHQHVGGGPNPQRQEGPHAHFIAPDPDNRFVLSNDLGTDQVLVYQLDGAGGKLQPNDPAAAHVPAGAGPRHLAFHPTAPLVYVINELDSTMTTCRWDAAAGRLEPIQTLSTLPDDFTGTSYCSDVHVAPSGRFVYGSNRGHDSIVVFAIDPSDGTLTPLAHTPTGGRNPRNFAIDPSGQYLLAANQDTDNIVTFRIDQATGLLEETGLVVNVPTPVCVLFAAN